MVTAPAAITMKTTVKCSGERMKHGRLEKCNNILIVVALEDWEKKLVAGKQEIVCDQCGTAEDFSRWA
jgi:hypothetical protein